MLWPIKLLGDALSPIFAVVSSVIGLFGLKRRDWVLMILGGLGTAVSLKQIVEITKSQDEQFDAIFGRDWQNKIPQNINRKLRKKRWVPWVKLPQHGPIEWHVPFGKNPDTPADEYLYADIMHPPANVERTGLALIYVHGGGWAYGKRNIQKFPYFYQLSSLGHLIMDIDYTLNPYTSIEGMVKDVKRAIIWLKANAEKYKVNPERIVLAGQSAGAHLSLMAAYTAKNPMFQPADSEADTSVRAVISYYGPPNLLALHDDIAARFGFLFNSRLGQTLQRHFADQHTLTKGIAGLMGGSVAEIPEQYQWVSPIHHVHGSAPPTMLIYGTHDLMIDFKAAEQFYRTLREHDVSAIFMPMPRCNHSFESVLPRLSPSAQTAAFYMERFIALMAD